MSIILLAGYTGSGKTEILKYLQLKGQQVINLEELACHNGSVFGNIPHQKPRTNYNFNKVLSKKWQNFDLTKPIYCETKSPTIGKLQIAPWLFSNMQKAPAIWLAVAKNIRLQKLVTTYGNMDLMSFTQALAKLTGKIDRDKIENIYSFYESGEIEQAFVLLMEYYDKAVFYDKNKYSVIGEIKIKEWMPETIVAEIIDKSNSCFK